MIAWDTYSRIHPANRICYDAYVEAKTPWLPLEKGIGQLPQTISEYTKCHTNHQRSNTNASRTSNTLNRRKQHPC